MTIENPADTAADVADNIDAAEIPMRVLKLATTTSLSNRSTLGYAIGCDDSNAIHFSLRSNTAAGMFSKSWIAYSDIADALLHADKITSSTLLPLYANTSRNNPGFLLAVLLGERLVYPSDRCYQRSDAAPFLKHLDALIDAGVDLGDAGVDLGDADAVVEADDVAEVDVPEAATPPMETVKRGRPSKRS
jgi:hypothetical protein